MSVGEAAIAIQSRSRARVRQLRGELAQNRDIAEGFLTQLAKHSDPDVRDWASWAAIRVLPQESAVALLRVLAEDRDSDVRMEAQRFLIDLDPAWARLLVPRYMGALRSDNRNEVLEAIWCLAQFREFSAQPAIEVLSREAPDIAVRNNARVAALVLAGAEGDLIDGLRAHDHVLSILWAKGLAYLGTSSSLQVLREFARNGPDSQCRERAAQILARASDLKPILNE